MLLAFGSEMLMCLFLKPTDTHLPAQMAAEKSGFQSCSLICVAHTMAVDFMASSGWLCSPRLGQRAGRAQRLLGYVLCWWM